MYDFNLLTIAIIDEYGEGIPVGWMISNREDKMVIIEFLNAVKCRTGIIQAKWVMSDDAPQFYNAWISVFGNHSTQKLLCAWHVDRSWRTALRDTIPSTEHQMEVYHHLQSLLHEIEEGKFRALLQRFLSLVQHKTYRFYTYFKTHYCSRIEQWASYNRVKSNINTNMFLEAFHRVLKVAYLNNKQNRRVDRLLTTLLKISRDKVFERFRKLEVGKPTHRICEINKRHKTAQEMQLDNSTTVIQLESQKWTVTSQTYLSKYYTVTLNTISCTCQLRCRACNICVHNSSCNCLDAILHSTICKHCHYVCMKFGSTTTDNTLSVPPPHAAAQ